MSRKLLQTVVAFASLLPIYLGVSGLMQGGSGWDGPPELLATVDSNRRFVGAVFLGWGAAFIALLPKIEEHTLVFRVLLGSLLVGGLARLYSWALFGRPADDVVVLTLIELALPLLLFPWQARVAAAGPYPAGPPTLKATEQP